ncbi:MAG: TPM domain-containing protein [Planctomycetota bacterium]|jgi:putative membrane protein
MQRASDFLSDPQTATVNEAVRQAEALTSAEIVPVVATASGRYDRAEDMFGLLLAVAAVVVAWAFIPEPAAEPGSWGGAPVWVKPVCLAAAAVVAFVVGAALAGYVGCLRRLFTPRKQMRDEVTARAREVFFDNRLHHTGGGTGMLVYVSIYERMAAVLADQAVLEKLGRQALDELCSALTQGLREGDACEAICRTIEQAGQQLASVLPRASDDVNELPDALVCID